MSLFSILKNNAKLALRGNWGKAIPALLIMVGASSLLIMIQGLVHSILLEPVSFDLTFALRYGIDDFLFQQLIASAPLELALTAFFSLLRLLLLAPLGLGILRWFFELVHGRAVPVSDIFRYFGSGSGYLRAVWMRVNLWVRYFLWALVFFALPGGILGAASYIVSRGEAARPMMALASVGVLLSGVLALLALLFYLALTSRYLLAEYLLCGDDSLTVKQAVRASVAFTRGYRFSLLWYQLSFIGWVLLCGFLLPLLYVYPYVQTALAMYARYIIEKGRATAPQPQCSTREFKVEEPPVPGGGPVFPPALPPDPPAPDPPADGFHFPDSRVQPGASSDDDDRPL